MLKFSIGFIHLAGLFILGLFAANVSVTDNIPETIEPGGFATVEVQISKGDVQGFAKLQLDIPAGLSVSPVDTKGASFTFSGGKAKFIWMTLPEMSDFTVTYKLKALPETSGAFTIGGIFSYIEENNRVDYNLSAKKVTVGSGIAAEPSASTAPEKTMEESTEETGVAYEPEVVSVSNDGSSRVITPLGDNTYNVKVSISGSGAKGYAKIEERLNPAYKVSTKNAGGSVFTQENGLLKFVWFDAPQTDKLEVIYQVTATESPKISGEFYFIDNNAPARMAIAASVTAEQPVAAISKVEESPKSDPVVVAPKVSEKTETAINTPAKTETVKTETKETIQEPAVAAKTKEVVKEQPKMSTVPGPEKGVTYKVQIAAGPNTVGKTYFSSKHSFTEGFQIENHEGWVKYTTGSHNAYSEARNNRERIRKDYNFDGPFVTAYNNGERITVQEALLITQQQWLP
jgi:hypothetical protein